MASTISPETPEILEQHIIEAHNLVSYWKSKLASMIDIADSHLPPEEMLTRAVGESEEAQEEVAAKAVWAEVTELIDVLVYMTAYATRLKIKPNPERISRDKAVWDGVAINHQTYYEHLNGVIGGPDIPQNKLDVVWGLVLARIRFLGHLSNLVPATVSVVQKNSGNRQHGIYGFAAMERLRKERGLTDVQIGETLPLYEKVVRLLRDIYGSPLGGFLSQLYLQEITNFERVPESLQIITNEAEQIVAVQNGEVRKNEIDHRPRLIYSAGITPKTGVLNVA